MQLITLTTYMIEHREQQSIGSPNNARRFSVPHTIADELADCCDILAKLYTLKQEFPRRRTHEE